MKIKIHFCRSDSLIPYLKSGEWQISDLNHHLETKNKASIVNRLSLPEFGDVVVKTTIVSRTLKQLLFWQKHSLKGRGGIHFFSHLIDLIKAASIH